MRATTAQLWVLSKKTSHKVWTTQAFECYLPGSLWAYVCNKESSVKGYCLFLETKNMFVSFPCGLGFVQISPLKRVVLPFLLFYQALKLGKFRRRKMSPRP